MKRSPKLWKIQHILAHSLQKRNERNVKSAKGKVSPLHISCWIPLKFLLLTTEVLNWNKAPANWIVLSEYYILKGKTNLRNKKRGWQTDEVNESLHICICIFSNYSCSYFFTENIFIIPVARKGVNKQASYAVLKQTYALKNTHTYRREIKGWWHDCFFNKIKQPPSTTVKKQPCYYHKCGLS